MNAKLLGFFSGFPTRHFTDPIAEVLKEALEIRDSLVFISCQPDNYTQNDEDSHGMHRMFVERNMPFAKYYVIDHRTKADEAVNLIREASCIFLMGGNATRQYQLMCEKGIIDEIRRSSAVILGVSAGAMNMGSPTVDIYETPTPYEGLGFANITIKAHYPLEDEWLQALKQVSMELPVCLMTDESAIFVKEDSITKIGEIYRLEKGEIAPLTQEHLEQMRKQHEKGRIIFLNGLTSSGKTSIVEALQERDDIFFYVVANDLFQEMVGDKYLQENYWKYLSEIIIMMYHTAKLYSDMGKNVLIDGILVEREEIKPHYQQLLEILKDNPLDLVEVYCPLDICRERNIARGDRYESQSDEQHELMAKNIAYKLRVDTSVNSSAECAEMIVNGLFL